MYSELWFVWAMILKRHSLDYILRLWIIVNATARLIKHYPTRVTIYAVEKKVCCKKLFLALNVAVIWSKLRPTRNFPVEISFSLLSERPEKFRTVVAFFIRLTCIAIKTFGLIQFIKWHVLHKVDPRASQGLITWLSKFISLFDLPFIYQVNILMR